MFFHCFCTCRPDEELVIDSDDEPGYLHDIEVATMHEYEKIDDQELERRLAAANIDAFDEQQLLQKLRPEELRAFKRIASDMFDIKQKSCFK